MAKDGFRAFPIWDGTWSDAMLKITHFYSQFQNTAMQVPMVHWLVLAVWAKACTLKNESCKYLRRKTMQTTIQNVIKL
eukprot:1139866-Pelagomonas_calceolata.AAC.6